MHGVRFAQNEFGYFRIKLLPICRRHLIRAAHGAKGCGEGTARSVFERLSLREAGLFANHTRSFDFLHMAGGIGNNGPWAGPFFPIQ